jgi:hypothetical protein
MKKCGNIAPESQIDHAHCQCQSENADLNTAITEFDCHRLGSIKNPVSRSKHSITANMMNSLYRILIVSALCAPLCAALAQQASKEQIKGLDEQVQDIKKDVLAIASELRQLEEKLLYPSNTHFSLFVSLAGSGKLRLDSMRLKLNGKDAAHHVYTFKELEALQSGGVQRIHTGNIRTGEHSLEVSVIGKTETDTEFRQVATYKFKKSVEPKLLEIVVDRSELSGKAIQFKE